MTGPAPTLLIDGVGLGESPRWHDGRLWFSDWRAREVLAVDLSGEREVMLSVPFFPFSFDWLPDGQLLVTSPGGVHAARRDGSLAAYADLSGLPGRPFNEIVVDGRSNAYLNGIGFDFPGGQFAPGSIVMVSSSRQPRRVAGGVAFPNGMVVTPDNSTLICAESYGHCLTAFDIAADGGLSGQRVWADLSDANPDGICLDVDGAVWYADVPHQRCVRVAEGGTVLQTVEVDRGCFACMLGGPDLTTLFVVAAAWPDAFSGETRSGQVLSVPAPAAGAGWPSGRRTGSAQEEGLGKT